MRGDANPVRGNNSQLVFPQSPAFTEAGDSDRVTATGVATVDQSTNQYGLMTLLADLLASHRLDWLPFWSLPTSFSLSLLRCEVMFCASCTRVLIASAN